jgi:hypothetical protein
LAILAAAALACCIVLADQTKTIEDRLQRVAVALAAGAVAANLVGTERVDARGILQTLGAAQRARHALVLHARVSVAVRRLAGLGALTGHHA